MLCCSRHAHHVATTEHSLCTELSPERFLSARIGSNQPVTQALCVSALVGLTSISLLCKLFYTTAVCRELHVRFSGCGCACDNSHSDTRNMVCGS